MERPFPLDLVPRVIAAEEWETIEPGSRSGSARSRRSWPTSTPGQVVTDGVVPRRLIGTTTHYHRAASGVDPPNGVRIHVAGVDLIRTRAGDVRVLEDNVRVPPGSPT